MNFYDSFPFKQFIKKLLFLLLLHQEFLNSHALMPDCPLYQMHFQKIIGVRPQREYLTERNRIYTNQLSSDPSTVGLDCYSICKRDADCIAYVHLLDSNECFGYSLLQRTSHYLEFKSRSFSLMEDPNAIFYEKICLKVPADCNDRQWVITKIPGNSLMLKGKKTIESLITRRECAEKCLFETDFKCLSASFMPSFRNNQERFNEQIHELQPQHKALGRCILSDKDKITQPDAFRTAPFDEEYIENQCHTRAIENDNCSYELYADSTFIEACTEAQYIGVSQKKCQSLCSNTTTFHCQGASYYYDGDTTNAKCLLHSEDIISMGPRSLTFRKKSVYMRRVKCLNIQVVCTKDEMTVKFTPKDWFQGKIYTSWHSRECSAEGEGYKSIALHLPIGSESKEQRCGIVRAYGVNGTNTRTFITTFVVVQNNPNAQTQGDRLIKVGCILTGPAALMQKGGDDAGVSRESKDDIPNPIALGSSLIPTTILPSNYTNSSDPVPKITLQIVDLSHNCETKDVKIGQNLELKIIAEYTPGSRNTSKLKPPDFRATSLIAKSEKTKDFIILIDERGCPNDESVFPALERIKTNKQNILRATFHAFKFVNSSNVDFDVNIHFCAEKCPKDNCLKYSTISANKTRSNQRHRRQLDPYQNQHIRNPAYISTTLEGDKSQNYSGNKRLNSQQPLTYNLRVHGYDEADVESGVYGENGTFIIIRGDEAHLNSLCLNQSLLIAVFIFLLILLTIIFFGCCFLIQRNRRLKSFDGDHS